MNETWKDAPTAAAQVVKRAMEERGWKQQDVALKAGLDAPNVSRWARGSVNPPDHRVAEVAAALGYDPRDFGITGPRALAAAEMRHSAIEGPPGDAPAWFVSHSETMHAYLQALEQRAVTAERMLERILITLERTR